MTRFSSVLVLAMLAPLFWQCGNAKSSDSKGGSSSAKVVKLDDDSLHDLVKGSKSGQVWLVFFHDENSSGWPKVSKTMNILADHFKGVAKIGSVAHKENAEAFVNEKVKFGEKDAAIGVIYTDGKSQRHLRGSDLSEEATVEALLEAVDGVVRKRSGVRTKSSSSSSSDKSGRTCSGGGSSGGYGGYGGSSGGSKSDVVELTDDNFERTVLESDELWMVAFIAPWCGYCKKLKPEWEAAAKRLKGKVNLGSLDATVHKNFASRYQIQGFPTIKVFTRGVDEPYEGERSAGAIETFALMLADANIPVEVVEVTDSDVFATNCKDAKLCVVAVLPHLLDCQSKCRNDYLQLLQKMAEKRKRDRWGWVWTEAGAQLGLEESLNIGGFGYPAMAVVNFRKEKYAIMKGAFSETGMNEFFVSVVGRGLRTDPLEKPVKVVKVAPWDGKDAEPIEDSHADL